MVDTQKTSFIISAIILLEIWVLLGVWFAINLTASNPPIIAWGVFLAIWIFFTAIFLSLVLSRHTK